MPAPDHAADSLSGRTLRASGWRLTTVAVQGVLQIVVLAILSRLVPPEDFGVLGIAMIFITFGTVLQDLGVSGAVIQRSRLGPEHIRAAFFLSLVMGGSFAAALWFSASTFAEFFRTPQVAPLLRFLSLSFIFSSVGFVSSARLWRQMEARKVGIAEIVGYLVGYGCVGIGAAVLGHGVWALGWAVVVQSFVRSAAFVAWAPQDLVPVPRWKAARELLGYGMGLSLVRLLNFLALKGDYVVVGRWLGAHALGLYERAYRLMDIFSIYFAGAVERVLFPALAEVQDDLPRLRRVFGASLGLVTLLYAPVAAGLCVVAPLLITALFGDAWSGAATPLRILSVALVFRAGSKICDSLVRATGAVYRSAWRSFVYAAAVVAGAWFGKEQGTNGVAVAVAGSIFLKYLMGSQLCLRILGLPWSGFARMHGPGLVAGAVVGAISWGASRLAHHAGLSGAAALGFVLALTGVVGVVVVFFFRLRWVDEELRGELRKLAACLPMGRRLLLGLVDAKAEGHR